MINQNKMKKEFVPYELAVKLKSLGFNKPCFAKYTIIPEDEIDWFMIPEQGITNKTSFGSSKNYNSKSFEEEGTISAPTFSQAFRWFREKYHIHGEPFYKGGLNKQTSWYDYKIYSTIDWINTNPKQQWKTYEEAEIACLERLIEIVESKSE